MQDCTYVQYTCCCVFFCDDFFLSHLCKNVSGIIKSKALSDIASLGLEIEKICDGRPFGPCCSLLVTELSSHSKVQLPHCYFQITSASLRVLLWKFTFFACRVYFMLCCDLSEFYEHFLCFVALQPGQHNLVFCTHLSDGKDCLFFILHSDDTGGGI